NIIAFTPVLIGGIEICSGTARRWVSKALSDEELLKNILLLAIGRRRIDHRLGDTQATFLPIQAALDTPGQNSWQLLHELFSEGGVLFLGRDGDLKRNELHTAPNRMIRPANLRFMVRGENNLVRRAELPEILPHPSGPDRITPREFFDQCFIEP